MKIYKFFLTLLSAFAISCSGNSGNEAQRQFHINPEIQEKCEREYKNIRYDLISELLFRHYSERSELPSLEDIFDLPPPPKGFRGLDDLFYPLRIRHRQRGN